MRERSTSSHAENLPVGAPREGHRFEMGRESVERGRAFERAGHRAEGALETAQTARMLGDRCQKIAERLNGFFRRGAAREKEPAQLEKTADARPRVGGGAKLRIEQGQGRRNRAKRRQPARRGNRRQGGRSDGVGGAVFGDGSVDVALQDLEKHGELRAGARERHAIVELARDLRAFAGLGHDHIGVRKNGERRRRRRDAATRAAFATRPVGAPKARTGTDDPRPRRLRLRLALDRLGIRRVLDQIGRVELRGIIRGRNHSRPTNLSEPWLTAESASHLSGCSFSIHGGCSSSSSSRRR